MRDLANYLQGTAIGIVLGINLGNAYDPRYTVPLQIAGIVLFLAMVAFRRRFA